MQQKWPENRFDKAPFLFYQQAKLAHVFVVAAKGKQPSEEKNSTKKHSTMLLRILQQKQPRRRVNPSQDLKTKSKISEKKFKNLELIIS